MELQSTVQHGALNSEELKAKWMLTISEMPNHQNSNGDLPRVFRLLSGVHTHTRRLGFRLEPVWRFHCNAILGLPSLVTNCLVSARLEAILADLETRDF